MMCRMPIVAFEIVYLFSLVSMGTGLGGQVWPEPIILFFLDYRIWTEK